MADSGQSSAAGIPMVTVRRTRRPANLIFQESEPEPVVASSSRMSTPQSSPLYNETSLLAPHLPHTPRRTPPASPRQPPRQLLPPDVSVPKSTWERIRRKSLLLVDPTLPTLEQLLHRETRTPLSQYNFYAFLRQKYKAEEYLNFWLDVTAHERTWHNWHTEERDKRQSLRKARRTRFRYPAEFSDGGSIRTIEEEREEDVMEASSRGTTSEITDETFSERLVWRESVASSTAQFQPHHERQRSSSSYASTSTGPLTEQDLQSSALRIYRKYSAANSAPDTAFLLPKDHLEALHDLVERQARYDPGIFNDAKNYVFDVMETYYFPRFTQAAATTNITRSHAGLALAIGMTLLTAGIALDLYMIFSGNADRIRRLWAVLPMWLGWVMLLTAGTQFLPFLVLFGVSENKLFRFQKLKETSVRRRHRWRALCTTLADTVLAGVTLAVFVAIPPIPLYKT